MSSFLPLFPLQLVVFPGEKLNLHVFEPRYKQLINECRESGTTFGIPAFIDGKIMTTGTELRLEKIEKTYPNGEMDICTLGLGLFSVEEVYNPAPQKLYIGADVHPIAFDTDGDFFLSERIVELVTELFTLLQLDKDPPTNHSGFTTYEIGHHIGFSVEQEYQLLNITSERRRQDFILQHLERLIPTVTEMNRLREKARMNGHFKNMLPPDI